MNPIAEWQKLQPWERYAVGIATGLALLFAAFSAGRFSAPLKVETRDVIKTVYQDKIVDRVQYVDKVVTVQAEAKTVTRTVYRDVERKPDGTVIDHTITKEGATDDKTSKVTDDKAKTEAKTEQVSASTLQEHTQTVTLRPSWAVTLQFGASLPKPWLPLYGPLVIGAEVDYRIVGGLSAGVWISTFGAAGLALKLEF